MRIAYLVLLITLATSFLFFFHLRENSMAEDQVRFERMLARAQNGIERRIDRCVDQMYNVRALFAASQKVGRSEWDRYIEAMAIRQEDLGIRSLGYIEIVPRADKEEFLKRLRADTDVHFTIKPEGERPTYFPVVYLGLFGPAGLNGRGLDHGVQSQRVETIQRAIDENKPSVTEQVNFLVSDGTRTNTGIALYLPIYRKGAEINTVEQRREAAQGLICAAINTKTAFAGLLGDGSSSVDLEIYDGDKPDPNRLFYNDNNVIKAGHPELISYLAGQTNVVVLNRQWTLFMSSLPPFLTGTTRHLQWMLQWLALSGGLVFSLLLFGITWVQVKARLQAQQDTWKLEQSQAALAAEKKLLDITLNSIAEGVITTDTSEKIISINRAAELLTGWPWAGAEGKNLSEVFHLIHERTQEPCANPVEQALQTCATVEMENHILLVARDESRHAIATSAAPIRDEAGKIVGAVLVFRDVTEKQKAEVQMLTESKLQSVGLLAGGIAHDFNNMLTAIIGNLSLARMPESSREEILQLLADAEKAALGAKDLTQQLLTFAKGGAPIRKPTLLHELIREACQFALRGTNVQCTYSLASDAWPVEADKGQIRQILNNLVINVRQAMPHGGKMEVRMENADLPASSLPPLPAGRYVKISIQDHGPGIHSEHLPRIFEPYFTTKKAGTGLGLATVYSVIRKHDGQIKVVSEPGKGTTFELHLPASQKPAPPVPTEPAPENFSGRGRVLIVDDEAPIRKFLTLMLQKFGYEAETANDGGEAIERYTTAKSGGNPFDAVIMDLTIPNGMGGCEAVRRLRELDPNVRAIASSGYSLDPIMANYRDYGFCGVIPKPYRSEDLNRILKEVIGNGRTPN
ncbi:MAG: CHASE domain-containing protein [Verrucomicrobiota bacterium]